jgi:UDP-glucose 4-epimerase
MKVLVTGIAGRLGSIIAGKLVESGHSVTGIDMRPWPERPEGVEVVEVDLRKRAAEDAFREVAPDIVVHMPSVTHLHAPSGEAHRLSLGGTKAAIDYCDRYGVKQAVFVGRHTYYGATPDAPLYHTEDEPPMASDEFPELLDLIAADLFAGSALWRYSSFRTCILRLCYTLGPSKHGTLGDYLHGPKVPTVLGFDPLFQFMHEQDAARAVAFAIERELKGVYNVAGPNPLPLSVLIEETGRQRTPIPESMFSFMLGKFGLPKLPRGAVAHLKYPIVIDARAFREASGFQHVYDEYDTLRDFCAVDWEERYASAEPAAAEPMESATGGEGEGATAGSSGAGEGSE